MKAFQFTLQAVRTVREREERRTLQQYSQALRLLDEAKQKLDSAEKELETGWRELRQARATQGPAEMMRLQDYCQTVEKRLTECRQALALAKSNAGRAFLKYLTAHQKRVLVEKHWENQKKRHDEEQRRREQKALDELARRGPRPDSSLGLDSERAWN
jgi:flagellar export protein FliJ